MTDPNADEKGVEIPVVKISRGSMSTLKLRGTSLPLPDKLHKYFEDGDEVIALSDTRDQKATVKIKKGVYRLVAS